MKILAMEKELPGLAGDESFEPHLKEEAERVWELYQDGVLREIYFRQDEHTPVLVLECADVQEAGEVLNTLPLVKAGLIAFDIIPLVTLPRVLQTIRNGVTGEAKSQTTGSRSHSGNIPN